MKVKENEKYIGEKMYMKENERKWWCVPPAVNRSNHVGSLLP
jgi:hypothetical protein